MDRSFSHHSWLSECIVHQRLGEDGGVLPSLHGVTSPTVAVGGKNMSEIRIIVQVSFKGSVQSLSHVRLFATPWTAAFQASLSITNSQGLLKLMPIESVMPSNHLILCRPLLLLPSISPSIRVFSSKSILRIRW